MMNSLSIILLSIAVIFAGLNHRSLEDRVSKIEKQIEVLK